MHKYGFNAVWLTGNIFVGTARWFLSDLVFRVSTVEDLEAVDAYYFVDRGSGGVDSSVRE